MSWRTLRVAVPFVAAVAVAALPFVVSDTFLLKVFTYVGINVVVVVGLALLFGYAGQVSLGHSAFVGIGAYTCALATVRMHAPWPVAFAAAGIVAGAGGMVLALPSLRLRGHYLAMATLAFGELASLAFGEATPITGGVDGFSGIPFPSLGPLVIRSASGLYWLVWAVAGIALLIASSMVSLRPGRAMRALHGSELGAQACGVDVVGVKVRAFVISAVLAGLAGALYASVIGFISPSVFTVSASVTFLAMAVIGGTGSLAGPVLAAALLTLLTYLDALIPGISRQAAQTVQSLQADVYGLAIILVVLFAPGGIGAMWRRKSREGERA
ncbi:MAG: branched-chain amino acid ABC transporter permease [Coriobacteriia bacterium]